MLSLATELGDAAFLLPTSMVVLLLLFLFGPPRTALPWFSAIGLCSGLTILAELASHARGGEFPAVGIRSPIGHTSLGTTFYGCAALTIAGSRGLDGTYTPRDVRADLLLVGGCVPWYALVAQPKPTSALGWQLPLILLAAQGGAMHGRHLSVDGRIAHLTRRLSLGRLVCPAPEEAAFVPASPGLLRS